MYDQNENGQIDLGDLSYLAAAFDDYVGESTFSYGSDYDGTGHVDLGDPDPNVYTSSMDFGWPLPWISWVSSRNEAAGYDVSEFKLFRTPNFAVHVLAILMPVGVLVWLWRARTRDAV